MPKRVIITGATSGIGRALAIEFLRRGNIVGATGRRQERLEELRAVAPERVYFARHDFQDYAVLPEVLDCLSEQMGGVEVVVANAASVARMPSLRFNRSWKHSVSMQWLLLSRRSGRRSDSSDRAVDIWWGSRLWRHLRPGGTIQLILPPRHSNRFTCAACTPI